MFEEKNMILCLTTVNVYDKNNPWILFKVPHFNINPNKENKMSKIVLFEKNQWTTFDS